MKDVLMTMAAFIASAVLAGCLMTGWVNPHLIFLIMGLVSLVLTLAAPSAWWMIAIASGFNLALITIAVEPPLAVEVAALAFGPALLANKLRSGDKKKHESLYGDEPRQRQ